MPVVVGTPPGVTASAVHRPKAPIPVEGLCGWWDADDVSTFSLSGTAVTQWRDKSANACHFGVNGGNRSGVQNGRTTVIAAPGSYARSTFPAMTVTDNFAMFVAARPTTSAGGLLTMGSPSGSTGWVLLHQTYPGTNYGFFRFGQAGYTGYHASEIPNDNGAHLHTLERVAGTWAHYIDGIKTTATTTLAPAAPTVRSSLWDTPQAFQGEVFEAVAYNRALSPAERQQVEAYLQTKWNLYPPPPFPLTIPWHSAFWASDPRWTKPADGGAVPSWRDAGTLNAAAIQATTTRQPVFSAANPNLNGKPAVVFDGVDDVLASTDIATTFAQPNHMYVVGWADPARAAGYHVPFNGGVAQHQLRLHSGNGEVTLYANSWVNVPKAFYTGPFVIGGLFNENLSVVRVNGQEHKVGMSAGTTALKQLIIGASNTAGNSYPFQGAIAFVGFSDVPLTETQIADLEFWAKEFYGVPVKPSIPTTSLQGWWDADHAPSFTLSGALVSQWNDKSGVGNHAIQATAAKQPIRNGIRNGRTTVTFASSKGMAATPVVPVSSTTFAWTMLSVFIKTGADTSFETPFTMSDSSAPTPLDAYNHIRSGGGIGGSGTDLRTLKALTVWCMSVARNTPVPALVGHHKEWLNGVLGVNFTATDNTLWSTASQKIMIGSRNDYATSLVGEIGEIILYDRELTDAERSEATSYLRLKWGIPFSLSAVAGLTSWWDASDTATITHTAGVVTQWNDKVGTRHLAQTDPAYQPATGLKSLNGRNVITVDGDYLQYSGDTGLNVGDCTVFIVSRENGSTGYAGFFTIHGVAGNDYSGNNGVSATFLSGGTVYNRVITSTSSTDVAGTWNVSVGRFDATKVQAYLNGGLANRNDNERPWEAANGGHLLGARWSGSPNTFTTKRDFAEIITFNRALSESEIQEVDNYLQEKWLSGPDSVPGAVGWWDASDTATITASAGKVSQWLDKSGSGRTMINTDGGAAYSPSTGVATINGKNALTFFREPDLPSFMYCRVPALDITGPITKFIVARTSSIAPVTSRQLLSVLTNIVIEGGTGKWSLVGSGVPIKAATPTDLNAHVVMANITTTTSTLLVDGVQVASGNVGSPLTNGVTFTVGSADGRYSWGGEVAEVIVYNRALTNAERQKIESYLKKKWGTP